MSVSRNSLTRLKSLSVDEIEPLLKEARESELEIHARIGKDPKWGKVTLNLNVNCKKNGE